MFVIVVWVCCLGLLCWGGGGGGVGLFLFVLFCRGIFDGFLLVFVCLFFV